MMTDKSDFSHSSLYPTDGNTPSVKDEDIIDQINEEIDAAMRTWKRRFIERLRQLENDPRRAEPQ